MTNNGITSVSSDHVDPSTLQITAPNSTENPLLFFTLYGQPDMDPLQAPSSSIMNEYTALSIPSFYSGVRFLAETIARLPKHIYQRVGDVKSHIPDHDISWVIDQEVNDLQTPYTFWSTFICHAVVYSNAYAAIKKDASGVELFNLPPDRMIPFRFNSKQWFAYDTGEKDKDKYIVFGSDEIIHLPALSFDGMQGLRMVKLMSGALGTARSQEQYVTKYYEQGGMMKLSIESEKVFTKEQILELKDQITNHHGGVNNAHKVMILGNSAKAKVLNPDLDTDKLKSAREWTVHDICRMLRIPPHMLYEMGRATWGNAETMGREMVTYTLGNWIAPLEQELARKLLTRQERKNGLYVRFDTSDLMKADFAALASNINSLIGSGAITEDEGRAKLDLPPHPGGIGAIPRVSAATVPLTAPTATPGTPTAEDPAEVVEGSDLQAKTDHREAFLALFASTCQRVGTKAEKATANAATKDLTIWGNIFSEEQRKYAVEQLAPVLTIYQTITGAEVPSADVLADRYASALRTCYAARKRGDTAPLPDLMSIVNEKVYGKEK